jgi:hypothetical protein
MIISTVKKSNDLNGKFFCYVVNYSDDDRISCVPHNEENIDYQNILQWVAEGNTIEEAD